MTDDHTRAMLEKFIYMFDVQRGQIAALQVALMSLMQTHQDRTWLKHWMTQTAPMAVDVLSPPAEPGSAAFKSNAQAQGAFDELYSSLMMTFKQPPAPSGD